MVSFLQARIELMLDIDYLHINGRYLFKDNLLYLFNGGSSLSFKMSGNALTIELEHIPSPGYFYIVVDKDYENKIKAFNDSGFKTCLFKQKSIHYIDIIKANEANDNTLVIKDISTNGELYKYDHQYYKKVRVFGDSTVAGYGILKHDGPASIHTSDSVLDFVHSALYELNMETDIFSASGWGLTFSSYTCPKSIGIIDFIDKVKVNSNIDYVDDFKPDLLIVSLGCNDNSYIEEDPLSRETRVNYFKRQYQALIESQIRDNKDLKILMIYGTLKEENAYYLYEETYEYLKPLYKNLYIHKFNGDNTAISNHAYVTAHEAMKEELKKVIKEIL